MKKTGWTRFLALCLAVISLSMLVSGGLGIRAANKERKKDESELQDLRSRIDEYREISAALMDRTSYESMSKDLEEKKKQYDTDTAKHRADLSAYSATNSGLELGTAALNQAETALETGKTQYEMGLKALKSSLSAFAQIDAIIGQIDVQPETIQTILFRAEMMLRDADNSDPYDGTVYKLEQAIRNLCTLIENNLPGEENDSQTANHPGDGASAESDHPEGDLSEQESKEPDNQGLDDEKPEDQEPKDQGPEDQKPEDQKPEDQEAANPKPENSEPEGERTNDMNPTEPAEDSIPGKGDTEPPHSPNTGEEMDLSGQLNNAIREVLRAADVVQDDVNTITALAESINIPPEILRAVLDSAGVSEENELRKLIISAIHELGIEMNKDQLEALGQMLNSLPIMDELMRSATAQMTQLSTAAETVEGEMGGLTEYLLELIKSSNSGNENYPFTEDEMREIRRAYLENKDKIEEALDMAKKERRKAYATVKHAEKISERIFGLIGQLTGAKATLDQTYAAMREVGEQIEEGEAALAEGRAQLNAAKEEQKKKAEELDKKKKDLDQQEKTLKQSAEQAEEQKELEDREKTLRTALLSREEIRRRSQYGVDLLSASEHWLEEHTEQTQERYRDRFDASLLMIVSAILAMAGALTSFGENRFQMITLFSALLCLAFSISAGLLLYRMGRGISWSAAVTAMIAAVELVLLIPTMPVLGGAGVPTAPTKETVGKTGTKTAGNPDQKKK